MQDSGEVETTTTGSQTSSEGPKTHEQRINRPLSRKQQEEIKRAQGRFIRSAQVQIQEREATLEKGRKEHQERLEAKNKERVVALMEKGEPLSTVNPATGEFPGSDADTAIEIASEAAQYAKRIKERIEKAAVQTEKAQIQEETERINAPIEQLRERIKEDQAGRRRLLEQMVQSVNGARITPPRPAPVPEWLQTLQEEPLKT